MADDLKQPTGRGVLRGDVVWHSSGEDEGPDVGLELGLGGGRSLYVGEMADATLRDAGIDLAEFSGSWWIAIFAPDGVEVVGPVADPEAARAMFDLWSASLRPTPAQDPNP